MACGAAGDSLRSHPMPRQRLPFVLGLLALAGCTETDSGGEGEPLQARYELDEAVGVPEGIAYSEARREFYLSSLVDGRITRVTASGEESLLRDPPGGEVTTVGLAVDPSRQHLWACGGDRLLVFDLDAGAEIESFDLTALDPDATCNDVTVLEDGRAFATDSSLGNLYTAAVGGSASIHASDPMLGGGLGANGVVPTPDQSQLVVGLYLARQLVLIGTDEPGAPVPIALEGDALLTPDGLEWLGSSLYSVSDAAVQAIALDGTSGSVTTLDDVPSGLSTATAAEGRLFVIKSEVTNHVLGQELDLPFAIVEVEVQP